jgi:hypothetical protein
LEPVEFDVALVLEDGESEVLLDVVALFQIVVRSSPEGDKVGVGAGSGFLVGFEDGLDGFLVGFEDGLDEECCSLKDVDPSRPFGSRDGSSVSRALSDGDGERVRRRACGIRVPLFAIEGAENGSSESRKDQCGLPSLFLLFVGAVLGETTVSFAVVFFFPPAFPRRFSTDGTADGADDSISDAPFSFLLPLFCSDGFDVGAAVSDSALLKFLFPPPFPDG